MKKKFFAIIGDPVSHSLSPILHNYWFKKYKIEAEYNLLNIESKDLETVIRKIRNGELNGINVTLPYKQKIIPYIDKLINDAEETKSVNTVFLDDAGILVGENTDVFGLQVAYLKEISEFKNKKALVIGAGGVSPSVVFALQKSKIQDITVVNRTYEKSLFLKKKFRNLNILKWDLLKENIDKYDVIINATSLGLKNGEEFSFDFKNVKDNLIYIDTIYNPLQTKTVKYLEKNNKKTFSGLEMFIHQGQKSFYLWTKINPEIDNNLVEILKSKLK